MSAVPEPTYGLCSGCALDVFHEADEAPTCTGLKVVPLPRTGMGWDLDH